MPARTRMAELIGFAALGSPILGFFSGMSLLAAGEAGVADDSAIGEYLGAIGLSVTLASLPTGVALATAALTVAARSNPLDDHEWNQRFNGVVAALAALAICAPLTFLLIPQLD